MKKQSGKNKFVINEEFIFDQDKYLQDLNNPFKENREVKGRNPIW